MAEFPATHSRKRLLVGALVIVGVVVLAILAWRMFAGDGPAATRQPGAPPWRAEGNEPVPVKVIAAVSEPLAVYIKALGTVTPLKTVTVRSRVDGELLRVAFREGQYVKQGDLLAEIDPRPFRVALSQVEGQQQQNLAELANVEGELQRFRDLQSKGYVSTQELANQEALVRQFQARKQSDQATVDEARLQLNYTRITAPISGRVGLRTVDAGNLVRAGDAAGLVTIAQMQPISVLFTIPEPDLPAVRAAAASPGKLPVEAWSRDESTRLATGQLLSMDNQIDTATGTLRLRAEFANQDESLFPNQFVNVRLRVRNEPAVVIPNAAVQFGAQGNFVFVVNAQNKAVVRAVQLGVTEGERVAVTKGVQAGERVVLEGLDRLRDGRDVDIIADSPVAAK
ncbi:MAG TPA: MdtA/MuxA family multidrug efflux RND transporter periplasmic adaptor subunit [Steroidobacteraceae bacterium]|nr:MdtA/MuxA family multidrug efflux RND transporter periplasmic adaptor subunit [Steroidobacteraceae bacterium]